MEADESSGESRSAMHSWRYRHHFSYKADQGKNIIVQCNLCLPRVNLLSTSKTSTSNLKKHLDRTHLGCDAQPDVIKRGRKKEELNGEESRYWQLKKVKAEILSKCMSQTRVDELVFNFMVEDCQSFQVLEQPGFRKLISGLTEGLEPMVRTSLFSKMDRCFQRMRQELLTRLSQVQHVCTTVDIWTAADHQHRRFLAMTCHWIDPETLERRSAALGFSRLRGTVTYDLVVRKIQDAHAAYGVDGKVRTTVADNASPLRTVFREYSPPESRDEEDEDVYESVAALLDGEPDQDVLVLLPAVQRCASHHLERIVSEDFWRAVSQGPACQLHHATMSKVYAVWSKSHQVQVGLPAAEELAKMSLEVPASIQWNVEFRALQKLAGLAETDLGELCARLETPTFLPDEVLFLKEYVSVFHPLAFALELFQAEQKCFLGLVIPTVLSLKNKLTEQRESATHLGGAALAVVGAIEARFQDLFASAEARVATATTPQFRLWWMPASERDQMCSLLAQEAALVEPCCPTRTANRNPPTIQTEDDFFSYGSADPVSAEQWGVAEEVQRYIEGTGRALECLQDFPRVKQLFLKYNTPLPSTAPVQGLFSQTSNMVSSRRDFLTEDYFERLQLLRYNSSFFSY